jgi:hypothetical protein
MSLDGYKVNGPIMMVNRQIRGVLSLKQWNLWENTKFLQPVSSHYCLGVVFATENK